MAMAALTLVCSFLLVLMSQVTGQANDPNCPPNQRASAANVQDYVRVSWTPPNNVNRHSRVSSFGGDSEVLMAPGHSYMFTNQYTDGSGIPQRCSFAWSVSANDPNCPPNQRASAANVQDYVRVSWTPPNNVNRHSRVSSFGGDSEVLMAPGHSYMFTNQYTDGSGIPQRCSFAWSVSGGSATPTITFCPSNVRLVAPSGESSVSYTWDVPTATRPGGGNAPYTRKTRYPVETSTFALGDNLVEYIFEERDVQNNLLGVSVCAFIVSVLEAQSNPCKRINMIRRADWLARDLIDRTTLADPVIYSFIHHTALDRCFDQTTCSQAVRIVQDLHMVDFGWWDIGYSFLIGEDGNVYEGRGWGISGAHTRGLNNVGLGFAILGDFREVKPMQVALTAAQNMIACSTWIGEIERDYKLRGHRDVVNGTVCPGDQLYAEIETWPNF